MQNEIVVLITGASSGFGKQLGLALIAKGYRVFGTSRNPGACMPIPGLTMLSLDVRNDSSVAACVESVFSQAGRLDVLVNNAGCVHEGPLEEMSLDELKDIFETNFFGAARMVNAVLPMMRERRGGHIINVGSAAGLMSMPFTGPYCASKYALEGYSESLRHELKPLGIHVSLVEPSFIKTSLSNHKKCTPDRIKDYNPHRQRMLTAIANEERIAPEPHRVIDTIARIISSDKPRLRHVLGKFRFYYPIRRIVPEPVYESILRSYWKLDRPS